MAPTRATELAHLKTIPIPERCQSVRTNLLAFACRRPNSGPLRHASSCVQWPDCRRQRHRRTPARRAGDCAKHCFRRRPSCWPGPLRRSLRAAAGRDDRSLIASRSSLWLARWRGNAHRIGCTSGHGILGVVLKVSCSDMAIEKASSPVAQPATQMRIASFAGRPWMMRGKTILFKVSKDPGPRKKLVTAISKSRSRAASSSESSSSRRLYSARLSILRKARRRRMRRLTIFSRYSENRCRLPCAE